MPKPRQSKLAKEHNITANEENEIKEAFGLFSQRMDGEKEGVMPIGDVRKAMMLVFSIDSSFSRPYIIVIAKAKLPAPN